MNITMDKEKQQLKEFTALYFELYLRFIYGDLSCWKDKLRGERETIRQVKRRREKPS